MKQTYSAYLFALTLGLSAVPVSAQYILTNGDAESGSVSSDGMTTVPIPGWTVAGTITVVEYGNPGPFPAATDRPGGGTPEKLFVGGPGAGLSTATQVLHIPQEMWVDIDGNPGFWGFGIEAVLGGWESDEDNARLVVSFLDADLGNIETSTVGPVTAADRNNTTALEWVSRYWQVPVGARHVQIVLEMNNVNGGYNHAFADDIFSYFAYPDPVETVSWSRIKLGW